MTQNHAILNNLEELELFKEYTRIQENGDYISLLEFWRETKGVALSRVFDANKFELWRVYIG